MLEENPAKKRVLPRLTDRILQFTGKNGVYSLYARIRGRSGPPGNQNAFRRRLSAGIAQRGAGDVLSPTEEQSIREEILSGLLADKGGAAQISTAMRALAEIIAILMHYSGRLFFYHNSHSALHLF